MALQNFSGFESGGTLEFVSSSGTFAVQSTTRRTGGYALQCNPTGAAVGFAGLGTIASTGADGNLAATDVYFRCYFRYGTKPASGDEPILQTRNGATTVKFELRLNSSGQLVAYNQALTLMATGTTALSANTWYRIEVRVGTGTTANWEAKIDGVSEISGTGDLTASNNSRVLLGKVTNRNSNTVNFYYDDTWTDDAAYPGPGQCEVMQADGNGNYTAFRNETNTGQGQYTSVDELPPNTTVGSEDYVLSTLTTTDQSSFTLESSSSAGISGTINGVKAVIYVARDGATNGNIKLLARSGTTDSLQGAIGTSAAYGNNSKVYAADPNTGSAWTTSALDAMEVGLRENSTSNKTRCTAAYAMVDFTPSTTVTKTHTTDSLLLKTQAKAHATDSLLKAVKTISQSVDSLLKGTYTRTHATDAYLAAAGVSTVTKTHATDSLLKGTLTKTHAADSLLLKSSTRVHVSDAFLLAVRTRSHSADSLLKGTLTGNHATDAYLSDGSVTIVNARVVARVLRVDDIRHRGTVEVIDVRYSGEVGVDDIRTARVINL